MSQTNLQLAPAIRPVPTYATVLKMSQPNTNTTADDPTAVTPNAPSLFVEQIVQPKVASTIPMMPSLMGNVNPTAQRRLYAFDSVLKWNPGKDLSVNVLLKLETNKFFKELTTGYQVITLLSYKVHFLATPALRDKYSVIHSCWVPSTEDAPSSDDVISRNVTAQVFTNYPAIPGGIPPNMEFICPLGQDLMNATVKAGTYPTAKPYLYFKMTTYDKDGSPVAGDGSLTFLNIYFETIFQIGL